MAVEPITHVDIAIVGAGPIGLTMANLLGLYGVQTLLIEKNESTVSEPRAVSIDDESLRVMQTIGLENEVCSNVLLDYGSSYLSPTGTEFAFVHPETREYGFPRRNAFNQDVLESQLKTGLARFPCVMQWFGHRLEVFDQESESVRLTVEAPDGRHKTVDCRFLLACDGAGSSIRGQLGMMLEGKSYSEKWLIIDILKSADPYRHTKVFCDPKRPGLALPGPNRTRRFEFMLLPNDDETEMVSEQNVRQLLKAHGPDEHAEIRRRTVYAFHARMAPNWKVGRVSLHGDAAHITPPFAGQGMNSGIRDCFNYAWKVAAVIKGQMSADILDSYEVERKDHAAALIKMAEDMGKVMMPKRTLNAFLTRAVFRVLRLCPPAYDYISQMKYKPKPKFQFGMVLPDHLPSKQSIIGRLFPQPSIAFGDQSSGSLDAFLGIGFSMIVFSPHPDRFLDELPKQPLGPVPVRRVCITPSDIRFPHTKHDIEFGRDMHGAIADFLEAYGECIVVLRPDRYVAAVFNRGDLASKLEHLKHVLKITPSIGVAAPSGVEPDAPVESKRANSPV